MHDLEVTSELLGYRPEVDDESWALGWARNTQEHEPVVDSKRNRFACTLASIQGGEPSRVREQERLQKDPSQRKRLTGLQLIGCGNTDLRQWRLTVIHSEVHIWKPKYQSDRFVFFEEEFSRNGILDSSLVT